VDAALQLLDRQVVDAHGRFVCKVDDLELTQAEGGGAPYVTAILAGPAALGPRLGGLLGRWFVAVQRRLHPSEEPSPARIGFGVVDRLDDEVRISLACDEVEAHRGEAWAREHVIAKIPGASHASE
jgi:hypothetical protein